MRKTDSDCMVHSSSTDEDMESRTPHVVIIGAGLSGLAAAETLHKSGLAQVTLLEAKDRIGGRIWSCHTQEGLIEMGANWIHGTQGNPLHDFAVQKKFQLDSKSSIDGRCIAVTEDGSQIPMGFYRTVTQCFKDAYDEAESIYQENTAETLAKSRDTSFEKFAWKRFKEWLKERPSLSDGDEHVCKQIFDSRLAFETTVSGCHSMDEVSLQQFGSYQELKGPHKTLIQGYAQICDNIYQTLPPDNVKLNCEVTKISWNSPATKHPCRNNSGRNDLNMGEIIISCSDGQTIFADYVMITLSLGFLKTHHSQMFEPLLPMDKRHCIKKLGFGTVDKVILHFENLNFLPERCRAMYLCWDKDNLTKSDVKRNWRMKITSFIPMKTCENSLLVWISGKEAEHVETMSDEEVIKNFQEILQQFLPDTEVPRPTHTTRTKWYSDPHVMGSYSFIPVGATVKDIATLAEPVCSKHTGKPVLFFAGEATHPSFYSTTHGAYLSGQREARLILEDITMSFSNRSKNDGPDNAVVSVNGIKQCSVL